MRTAFVFAVGLMVGVSLTSIFAQGSGLIGSSGGSHFGIRAQHYDEELAFYTQKMGFREIYTRRDDKGQPQQSYLQISRTSFLELQNASATNPPGLGHFGINVDDINATAAALKQRGVKADAPADGNNGSVIIRLKDPEGVTIELTQLGAESPLRKALQGGAN